MELQQQIEEIAKAAKGAALEMAKCPTRKKNKVLRVLADLLTQHRDHLKAENKKDLEFAKEKGLSTAMIDRLTLTDQVIDGMVDGLRYIETLADPVGLMSDSTRRPNGLEVSRMRIPLGVIGIIYESRPNVTIDAAGLCLKAGNCVILRGGSESLHSNKALAELIQEALRKSGLPGEAAQVIPTTDRSAVNVMLAQEESIDLIIPRGGEGLIRFVVENSKIPVLKHYKGVCHLYVDAAADFDKARKIAINSKVQRPGVCNALETLLVHEAVAKEFLPEMAAEFRRDRVELRGCIKTKEIVPDVKDATEEDYYAEFLDLILAVKVVSSMDEAIAHMAQYGSSHTESIITKDYDTARRFIREVDSSGVIVNASTRFNDGGELGLGAEIGISTSKLHAFGPMGLEELTTRKFVVFGDGQIRE